MRTPLKLRALWLAIPGSSGILLDFHQAIGSSLKNMNMFFKEKTL